MQVVDGEVVFSDEDVPSLAALQNSGLDTDVSPERMVELLAPLTSKDFGTNESRWVAALYMNALADGRSFSELVRPIKMNVQTLAIQTRFNVQLTRFSNPDLSAFYFCKFPTYTLKGGANSSVNVAFPPAHEELADYYALIRSLHPVEMLTTVATMLADDISQPISPILLQKTLKLQKELILEGEVLPLRQLRICAAMWNSDEVVKLLVNKIPLNEAVDMVVQGATDVDEIIQFKRDIPQVWLDEIFDF